MTTAKETAATAPCFGKLYDEAADECKKCKINGDCKKAFTPEPEMKVAVETAAPAPDTSAPVETAAPVVEATVVETAPAELETKVSDDLEKEAAEKEAEAAVLVEAETIDTGATAPSTIEATAPIDPKTDLTVKADPKAEKPGKKATKKAAKTEKAAAPAPATDTTAPATARERTALRTAGFKKADDGKFILTGDLKKADLIVNKGDIVKIVNPRSKYNGQNFVISCYSEKYECLRGTQSTTKQNADFLPNQIEIVERAASATA